MSKPLLLPFGRSQPRTYPRGLVLRVIDGDTLKVDIDLGFGVHHYTTLRLGKIDAPETNGAKTRAALFARVALGFLCLAYADAPDACVISDGWDKYGGRVLGDLRLHQTTIADMLLAEGTVRRYSGDRKRQWSPAELTQSLEGSKRIITAHLGPEATRAKRLTDVQSLCGLKPPLSPLGFPTMDGVRD